MINDIEEKTAGLSEDEKPQVFLKIGGQTPEALSTFTDTMPGTKYQVEIAGGINIAADLPGPGYVQEVDQEWLDRGESRYCYGDDMGGLSPWCIGL